MLLVTIQTLFAFLSDTFSWCLYSFYLLHSDSGLFLKEFSLFLWIWCSSLSIVYIMNVLAENHSRRSWPWFRKGQYRSWTTMALSEKDYRRSERKRIAQEIPRSWGTLTGISARLRCCWGLDWYRSQSGKRKQVKAYRKLSGKDSRCDEVSQPPPSGCLEDDHQKCFWKKDDLQYRTLSTCRLIYYEWVDIDMDVMIEDDTIFRVIQESMTNAVHYGRTSQISLHFF